VLNYIEDSEFISLIPEDILGEFSFANRGEDTGYSVRLTIVTESNGTLLIPESFNALMDIVTINNNDTSEIFVVANMMLVNPSVDNFTSIFRTAQISFQDQAPRR